MTVHEFFLASAELRHFVNEFWVKDRRCPIHLGDWLMERGQPGAARCAMWCAVQPDREVYMPNKYVNEQGGRCGPFPTYYGSEGFWGFYPTAIGGGVR